MLARIRREPGTGARGLLRVYLGMAPGVGKTYAMLLEGRRRKQRGIDVVVGYVETYDRALTVQALGDLEIIPRKRVAYRGLILEEMDTEAVLGRNPALALVDELAHTNTPGSKREKRWQDVEELLEAGITVLSTVNVQHLESLADIVQAITGIAIRERIPDRVVDAADEVELVDISPDALRQRLRDGSVYPPERAQQALNSYFREGNLTALRELALRKVSTEVERDLENYMWQHQIDTVWPAAERVMVCVDEQPTATTLVRRAWRQAHGLQTDLIAVFVEPPDWSHAAAETRRAVEENLRFAEDLGAKVVRQPGENVAETLARVAREQNVGTIVVGHERHSRGYELFPGSVVVNLLRLVQDIDVHVVAAGNRKAPAGA
jgi:two-component system sensor histidine kinase KdpD